MKKKLTTSTLIKKNLDFLTKEVKENFDNLLSRHRLQNGKYELFMSVNNQTGIISNIFLHLSNLNTNEELIYFTATPILGLNDNDCNYQLNYVLNKNIKNLSNEAQNIILETFSRFNSFTDQLFSES